MSDDALTGTGRSWAYEYDGLQSGELAWVMSKQFAKMWSASGTRPNTDMLVASPVDFSGFMSNINSLAQLQYMMNGGNNVIQDVQKAIVSGAGDGALLGQNTPLGLAGGPDRMQRLAYTKWIEALFITRLGRQTIDLASIVIADQADGTQQALDSELDYYSKLRLKPRYIKSIDGPNTPDDYDPPERIGAAQYASIFAVPDIAYGLQHVAHAGAPLQVPVPQLQGIFVMEQGPFLRSYGVDHYPVTITADGIQARSGRTGLTIEVDRHLGSELAQRALTAELKKIGLMNWTPDGICLSKFATGPDGMADAEFDSRSGQLFNVGVQGPCITTSWVGDKDMVCMPMDKVFMLIVGSLSYELYDSTVEGTDGSTRAVPDEVKAVDKLLSKAAEAWVASAAALTRTMAAAHFTPVFYDADPNRKADDAAVGASALVPRNEERLQLATATGFAAKSQTPDVEAEYRENSFVREDAAGSDGYRARTAAQNEAYQIFKGEHDRFKAELSTANLGAGTELGRKIHDVKKLVREAEVMAGDTEARRNKIKEANDLIAEIQETAMGKKSRISVHATGFRDTAQRLRSGRAAVKRAELSDFRIMRATSSFLANTSHAKSPATPGWEKSRCGLPIGYCHTGVDVAPLVQRGKLVQELENARAATPADPARVLAAQQALMAFNAANPLDSLKKLGALCQPRSGNAEYILGGWCIGTVVDSAASRATIHAGQVRTAPSSMAINVNVNVEWWGADKLYQHYQDVDRGIYKGIVQKPEGTVHMRTQPAFRDASKFAKEENISEDEALQVLKKGGRQDIEGAFMRPDKAGANADPSSMTIADREGKKFKDEDRYWAAAAVDHTERSDKAHMTLV